MEPISSKQELIETLESLIAVESIQKKWFEEDTHTCQNFEFIEKIESMLNDEIKHIAILKNLIKILKS